LCSFWECLERQHSRTIIRNIAWYFVNRVIHGKNGQNSICCDQRRFLLWINCTDKDINRSQLWWLSLPIKPTTLYLGTSGDMMLKKDVWCLSTKKFWRDFTPICRNLPQCKPVKICFPVDWIPFWELIQKPR
jgi:hypothetical protein